MQLSLDIGGKQYAVNTKGKDISIPMHFDGPQPNTYGVPKASSKAFEGDGWVGDTRRGGSCNFETYELIPHCNGTHTECVGHIANERISIREILQDSLIPCTVISVRPHSPIGITDTYDPPLEENDLMINLASLKAALAGTDSDFYRALVIRTYPNDRDKLSRDYTQHASPFFSLEAMRYLLKLGVQHLLVDFPSVDRMFDEGKLSNHHLYWEVPQGSHDANPVSTRTITEMIFVPDAVADGAYLLNLQIAPFVSDAAPSRPMLFELKA